MPPGELKRAFAGGVTGENEKPGEGKDDMPATNASALNGTEPADRAMNRMTARYASKGGCWIGTGRSSAAYLICT
jgi:hypothetical protein